MVILPGVIQEEAIRSIQMLHTPLPIPPEPGIAVQRTTAWFYGQDCGRRSDHGMWDQKNTSLEEVFFKLSLLAIRSSLCLLVRYVHLDRHTGSNLGLPMDHSLSEISPSFGGFGG